MQTLGLAVLGGQVDGDDGLRLLQREKPKAVTGVLCGQRTWASWPPQSERAAHVSQRCASLGRADISFSLAGLQ